MIPKMVVGAVGATLFLLGGAMSAEIPLRVVASISGNHLLAIQAALPEIAARKLDLSRYQVTIVETEASLVILFGSPKRHWEERGNVSGDQLGLEVEVDKKTNQVVRTDYIR